jgi:hypothetical protein
MVAFYNQADQDLYAGGLQYLPQEQYRLNLGNNNQVNRLDFSNLSNSGIMSQAQFPYIYPSINQGGGEGGGGFTGPAADNSGFDYESEAYGIDPAQGLTEEEQEALNAQIAGPQMGKLGMLGTLAGFMTAPLTTIGFLHRRNQKKQKELERNTIMAGMQADEARQADRAREANPGVYSRADAMGFTDGKGGGFGSKSTGTNEAFGNKSGRGRSGYFYGGLASIL